MTGRGRCRLLESFRRVRAVVDDREPPTFFEMTTAMALTSSRRSE